MDGHASGMKESNVESCISHARERLLEDFWLSDVFINHHLIGYILSARVFISFKPCGMCVAL